MCGIILEWKCLVANSDGINHFRSFGSGGIFLEDLKGGGDQDFDDLILCFDFQLTSV